MSNILQSRAYALNNAVTQEDLVCFSEQEIKHFAFNPDSFLRSGKTRHMALCRLCQGRIAQWIEVVRHAEEHFMLEGEGKLPQA